jgi:peptidoglycan/LPS O-acetylase OafA/YrhL
MFTLAPLMNQRIDVIQLLRGLAALMVCCFHMKGILKDSIWGKMLFQNGSLGVPLFFMISGFILYVTTSKAEISPTYIGKFALKRLLRIVPLYYLLTFVYLAVQSKLGLFFENPTWLFPMFFFYPSYLGFTGPSYGFPPLAVGWSLNYELYFYLLLAITMFLGKWRWMLFSGIILASVFIVPLITNGYVMQHLSQWYAYPLPYFSLMTNPVLLFFLAGVGLGRFHQIKTTRTNSALADLLVLLATTNFIFTYLGFYQILPGFWSSFFNSGFLLIALIWRNKIKPFEPKRWLVYLGDISFSLYLIHPIVLSFLPKLIRALGFTFELNGWLYFTLALFVILLSSAVSYVLLEKNLNRLAKKI